MSTEEIKRVLDEPASLGTMELTLSGGEPLLKSDFTDIISYAVEKTGFSVKLFSSLTLLTESIADLLASLPLNSVETTILGSDETSHNSITGCPVTARICCVVTVVLLWVSVLLPAGYTRAGLLANG